MKKFISLIFLGMAIFNSNFIYAQVKLIREGSKKGKRMVSNTSLPTAKITIDAERVKSTARYVYDTAIKTYVLVDSVDYTWSFGRGSKQVFMDIYLGTNVEIKDYDVREFKYLLFSMFPRNKWVQTFDSDGNIIQNTQKRWDFASSSWEDLSQIRYSYSGKLKIEEVEQEMDKKTLKWLNAKRHLYTYAGTNLTEDLTQGWNAELNIWENSSKYTCTYTLGHIASTKFESWDSLSSTWVIGSASKMEYIFSGSDILESTISNWNITSSIWQKSHKDSNIYIGGLLAEKWNMFWNTLTDSLYAKNGQKFYYSSGMLSEINGLTDDGKVDSKILYLYDGKNNTDIIYQGLNDTFSIWENRRRQYFTYNKNGSLIIKEQQEWKDGEWEPIETNDLFDTRFVFHYETFTSNIEDQNIDIVKTSIYPNPATTDNVSVDYFTNNAEPTEIVLRDVLGRELAHITENASIGDHSVIIPIKHLSQGIYMVSIYSNGQLQQTMKLLK